MAECSGRLAGFALAAPTQEKEAARPLELTMLYVLREFHGTGAGQALLDAALGDSPAQLWVARDNPRARRFHERNGFSTDGAESPRCRFEAIPAVRMVRGWAGRWEN